MDRAERTADSIWSEALAAGRRLHLPEPAFVAVERWRAAGPVDDSRLMHGGAWRPGIEVAGWLLSEKYDGCRACWDGARMWSREGNEIAIPVKWARALPGMDLDGEIWAGRGGFETARLATQYGRFDGTLRFMVFDAHAPGDFVERQAVVHAALRGNEIAVPVKHQSCRSTAEALLLRDEIKRSGGEGVIARDPDNYYEPGRTGEILKLK